jgi:hypothetical protein
LPTEAKSPYEEDAQKMGIKNKITLQLIEMFLISNLLMKVLIGESSNQSYLLGDKIIEAR